MANNDNSSELEWVKPKKLAPAPAPAVAAKDGEAMSQAEMEWIQLNQQLAR